MISFCCLIISSRCLEGGGRAVAAVEVEVGAMVLPAILLPSSLLMTIGGCSARGVGCRGNGAAAAS